MSAAGLSMTPARGPAVRGRRAGRAGRIPPLEASALAAVLGLVATGLLLSLADRAAFEDRFTAEDGLIETAGAAALVAGVAVCWLRAWRFGRRRRPRLAAACALLGLALLTGAGEELSWGQRLFGFAPPAWLASHNAQGESTLHNLVVGPVELKRLLEPAIDAGLVVYLLVLPAAWGGMSGARRLAAAWGVPVPRPRHFVAFGLAYLMLSAIPSMRKWEVYEFAAESTVAIAVAFPLNRDTFVRPPG